MEYTLHNALVSDIKGIHALLLGGADAGLLLPRSLSDLYGHTRDFAVMKDSNGQVVACCALAIVWDDLAEIRSLLVEKRIRGKGLGRILTEACLKEAGRIGIRRVFTLTYQVAFFKKMGFAEVGKDVLPQKIWADCIHCPKFPDCDEIAMLRDM